ncbi:hypothetical protein [Methanobacterium sp. ACI-7]
MLRPSPRKKASPIKFMNIDNDTNSLMESYFLYNPNIFMSIRE